MAEKDTRSTSSKRITERERLTFIGFDVFPGEAKELFKSDAEKEKYLASVRARHEQHDHLRDTCTLLEERVSSTDRFFMAFASIIILLALALPWYSAYNEIVEEPPPGEVIEEISAPAENVEVSVTEPIDPNTAPGQVAAAETVQTSDQMMADTGVAAGVAESAPAEGTSITTSEQGEELITAFSAKKKIHKEYTRAAGYKGLLLLGSAGSKLFSSGIALILTVILFVVYTLLCVGLPIYNLYGLYGLKGDSDTRALKLKKMLRLNWIPLMIFFACLFISFLGGEYSFNAAEVFTSIGTSYSPLAFLGTLSWGVFVSLACFILCAAKGTEI
jgi:hypothetical protein